MPIGIGTAVAIGAVSGGVGAAGTIYAAHAQGKAADKASKAQSAGAAAELAYMKEKDASDQANWEKTYQQNLQQFQEREARLAPYRQNGEGAARNLGSLMRMPPAGGSDYTPPKRKPLAMEPAQTPVASTQPQMMWDPASGRLIPVPQGATYRQLTAA